MVVGGKFLDENENIIKKQRVLPPKSPPSASPVVL